MEPHPIPQNVSTFQFRLVGDMTLKQFLYLGGGALISYLVFVFFINSYPIIAWPIVVLSTLIGAAFAFLPINSRPLDHWVGAFLKAIYSPTKRAWKKNNKLYQEDTSFSNRYNLFLNSLQPSQSSIQPSVQITNQIIPTTPIPSLASATTQQQVQPPKQPSLPTTDELAKTVDLAKEAQNLQLKIIQSERTLGQIRHASQAPNQTPINYSAQVNQVMTNLQNLVTQASDIQNKLDAVTSSPKPTVVSPSNIKEKIKVIIPEKPKHSQMALTTFPNVLSGVVKDKAQNYLEGVVAVIYDKEGLPVRALKTNKLGQFTGSTPLPNATYTLELEKDNYTFDVLQIELTGEVLPPLMITAKN